MQLNGSHILNAPPHQVWKLLLDPEVLTRSIPGLSKLEDTGNHTYKAISDVKIGPVNGSFSGTMEVVNQVEPKSFTLKMKQNGKIGNVNAEGTIELKAVNNTQTEVLFAGEAKLSGTLARTGQRVLSGVANTLTAEFFQALENEIHLLKGETQKIRKLSFWTRLLLFIKGLFARKNKLT